MKTTKKRPKIGDVIEIAVPSGLAYAQCINKHTVPPHWGHLLRVFPTIHESQPSDFSEIINGPELFTTFFSLGTAVSRGLMTIVARLTVPEQFREFPIFRASHRTPEGYKGGWWLWDGEKQWYVGELTPEQRKYPIKGIWNNILLVKRIEEGWTSIDKY